MIRPITCALALTTLAAFAASPPLESICSPFNAKDCEIVWGAPTNFCPPSVKVFRVVPRTFSPDTVSNLLEAAGLKSGQRKRVDQDGVFAGKDVRFFADRLETRQLNLIPSQGFIVISRLDAVARIPKEMPAGVPDSDAGLRLTVELLGKVGIQHSELATNANGKISASFSVAEVLRKDKSTSLIVTNVVKREVYLSRQIEGIPVWRNNSGVTASLGNEGRFGYLSIVWRAIKPERDCAVPSAENFVSRIKSGQAMIPSGTEGSYKRIVVTKASLFYWENPGSEAQGHIYPFAVLDAKTYSDNGDSAVQLFVPFAGE